MKKKIVIIALVVAILALAAFGSLAYFIDTEGDKNTMEVGSVEITQNEYQRNAEGNALVPFEDDLHMVPAVGTYDWAPEAKWVEAPGYEAPANAWGQEWKIGDDEKIKNVHDKYITVTNKGKSDAYVRTILYVEYPVGSVTDGNGNSIEKLYLTDSANAANNNITRVDDGKYITVGGVQFAVLEYTYNYVLEPGKETFPSLKQLYFHKATDNAYMALWGEDVEVYAISQAVQADGFADAKTALDEAFGATTEATAAQWLADYIASTTNNG